MQCSRTDSALTIRPMCYYSGNSKASRDSSDSPLGRRSSYDYSTLLKVGTPYSILFWLVSSQFARYVSKTARHHLNAKMLWAIRFKTPSGEAGSSNSTQRTPLSQQAVTFEESVSFHYEHKVLYNMGRIRDVSLPSRVGAEASNVQLIFFRFLKLGTLNVNAFF